jgi:hypothetical protein
MPFAGFTTCITAPTFWRELQISKKKRSTGGPQVHVPRQLYLNHTRRSSALSGELQGRRGEPPFWRYTKWFSAAQYPFPRFPYWWCELNELYPWYPVPTLRQRATEPASSSFSSCYHYCQQQQADINTRDNGVTPLFCMLICSCSGLLTVRNMRVVMLSPARGLAQLSQPDRLRNGTRLMRDGHTIERRAFEELDVPGCR